MFQPICLIGLDDIKWSICDEGERGRGLMRRSFLVAIHHLGTSMSIQLVLLLDTPLPDTGAPENLPGLPPNRPSEEDTRADGKTGGGSMCLYTFSSSGIILKFCPRPSVLSAPRDQSPWNRVRACQAAATGRLKNCQDSSPPAPTFFLHPTHQRDLGPYHCHMFVQMENPLSRISSQSQSVNAFNFQQNVEHRELRFLYGRNPTKD